MAPDRSLDPAGWLNAQAYARGWATRADDSLAFNCPELVRMHQLWKSVAGKGLPSRAQFTARMMKSYLRQLIIVGIERPAGQPRRYRHRYVGTDIVSRFGELTGLCFEDFLPEPLLPRTIAAYDAIVDGRRPLRMITKFQLEKASFLSCEFFAAPLAEDGCTPNMVMNVAHFFVARDTASPAATSTAGLSLS